MLLIPAIDIKDGKCVPLRQGDMNQTTVFSDDPVSVAQRWVNEGARRLHIVDLDGAMKGEPVNADIVHRIAENHPQLPIQIGGGIRNEDTVEIYIQAGVRYVIIGTQAINEPHLISDLCTEYPAQRDCWTGCQRRQNRYRRLVETVHARCHRHGTAL